MKWVASSIMSYSANCGREDSPSPEVKKLVKDALIADEDIDYHKLSKLRGLYFRTGGDPDGIYEQLYG